MPITGRGGKVLTIDDLEEAVASGKKLLRAEHCYCCSGSLVG